MAAGVAAGFVIGVVAALLGVAGGRAADPDARFIVSASISNSPVAYRSR
jgi:hypothetical protein